MSGHSKWHSIKHKKAATDAKRGKIFNKHAKLIETAARSGGGDPDMNPRLRTAVQAARDDNMPNDKIEKAIKKGTGEIKGVQYEEIMYEAYGPSGVAMIIQVLTDNKNRTVGEIRHILQKHGGHLGESGSVAWNFDQKGVITVPSEGNDEDKVMEIVLEAGAEDMSVEDDVFQVTTDPKDFMQVREALTSAGTSVSGSEVTWIPSTTVELEEGDGRRLLKLMEALDDHEDVQGVSANFDIPDDILERIREED
ncbi:MAG: YebC/PmpR family DNA-binding transcriptional regulator [Candidatus Eisenbacteria bacterium]|nr:YebC/PmpR family DNA-binding transcriptional regulator [Candidatus Eisenbacteria bacterium]